MSSYDVGDNEIDPDALDERAERVRDGEFLVFEEHADKRE